ncbi:MAG: DNA polymerase IV [Pseudomonadota bacterium]
MTDSIEYKSICAKCGAVEQAARGRCSFCGGPRIAADPELATLAIAHLDCDAFYAAIEKRDDPSLEDRPVIVGGSVRGVVTTACYVARTYGVRSAMPMFKALKACPDAAVVKPNFSKYVEAGRAVRALMTDVTPAVDPLSIDEAFMDLSGTEKIHKAPPFRTLGRLQARIKEEIGITASIGLSHNKFLAKLASDLEKPEGFTVIPRARTAEILAPLPVSKIWGVGAVTAEKLAASGVRTIGALQQMDARLVEQKFGKIGARLAALAWGRDARSVTTARETKSVSSETTFNEDTADEDLLRARLWSLCEDVSTRMKSKDLIGATATLKVKTSGFRTLTRQAGVAPASNLARTLYEATTPLLSPLITTHSPFRLIGVGYSGLAPASEETPQNDLFVRPETRWAEEEKAVDAIRARFGPNAISAGRAFSKSSTIAKPVRVARRTEEEG